MKLFRRFILKGALAVAVVSALSPVFAAQPKHEVDVVKIMAFSCPYCRASEAQDKVIEQALLPLGGKFVWAPIPPDASESGSKERVYYASRKVSRDLSDKIKDALYKGSQDMGIELAQMPQVYAWIQRQFPDMTDSQLQSLFDDAQGPDAERSLERAARLAVAVGANLTPTYVIIVDGHTAGSVDVQTVPGGSLSALRDEVINRIKSYSK